MVDLLKVYSDRYVDQMGIIGFFPGNYVNETYTFQHDTVKIPTTVSPFIIVPTLVITMLSHMQVCWSKGGVLLFHLCQLFVHISANRLRNSTVFEKRGQNCIMFVHFDMFSI